MNYYEKIRVLEVYLMHYLQNKIMPDVTLSEITPVFHHMMGHLQGVSEILKAQDAPEYLIDAALFHSVYGEEHSRTRNMYAIFSREKLKNIIGEKAEEIVYQYSIIPFDRTKNIKKMPKSEMERDLWWLDISNKLEMKMKKILKDNYGEHWKSQ